MTLNRTDRYTTVAIALHWLIALAIVALLAMGLIMTSLPPGPTMFSLFQLHKSIGITVLALSLIRLAWRLTHRAPPLPGDMPKWEKFAARATHWAFYVMMIGMPLTGWAIVSTSSMNLPTVLYGIVTLPHLPGLDALEDKKPANHLFHSLHDTGAWVMIALLCLHVAAALMHQFIRRDEVVHHMLPFIKAKRKVL
jgi:cytochrome b561